MSVRSRVLVEHFASESAKHLKRFGGNRLLPRSFIFGGSVLVRSRTTTDKIRNDAVGTRRLVRMLALFAFSVGMSIFVSPNTQAQGFGKHSEPRVGTAAHRKSIIDALPLDRLTPDARQRILSIAEKPTLFRQLPREAITCDPDMFLFLTRNPDALVGLWDLMGVTQVQSQRVGPFQIEASDGVGTLCKVDLVYGDDHQHIFVVNGSYDGRMTPKTINGKGVFVLNSSYAKAADGRTTVYGTLDCFVQLESLGMDLIVRTLSPIIGRSADSNYSQTAAFIAQVSQSSAENPSGMLDIASRLPQVDPPTRQLFADTIVTVARRSDVRRSELLRNQVQQTQSESAKFSR